MPEPKYIAVSGEKTFQVRTNTPKPELVAIINTRQVHQAAIARLFAAAPELLSALDYLLTATTVDLRPLQKAGPTKKAAVRKAQTLIAQYA